MSRMILGLLLATTAVSLTVPTVAHAAEGAEDGDAIIVTARREAENVQDVPVSMQVVTGDSIQKLAITSAEDVSKLAPGLTLVNAGASTQVSLRGVSWRPGSGTPATPLYFNEIGFDPGNTVASIFDIGQIEVLRGPQGTSRGAPSISGAITIATKKPDLSEFGGYVQGFYATADHWDVQAAINVPVIKDMLAIRVATNIENSEGDRVYSINSTIKPKVNDRSFRATLLFKPTDTLSITAMYQRRKTDKLRYDQVTGPGSPGAPASPTAFFGTLGAIPANFNGPALTVGQRASVADGAYITHDKIDLLTINANWDILGQKLSYNFGKQFNRSPASFNAADPLNMLPGFEPYNSPDNNGLPKFRIHEIRLSGARVGGLPIDYDIGWYSKHSGGMGINFSAPTYLAGAFGPPNAQPGAFTTPNSAYVLNSSTNILIGQKFDSFYGNLKFHISENTEFSAGIARVRDRVPVALDIKTFAARTSVAPYNVVILGVPEPFRPFFPTCESISPALITSPTYAGVCDSPIPAGIANSTQNNNDLYKATLYSFSLSHKFSDNVMIYASTGSSFRSGLPAINNPGLPANLTSPLPEKAKSYEIGIKTTLNSDLRINAAVFQIDYANQLTTFEGVSYWNTVSNRVARTSLAFYRNVDARVRGFELEVAAQPIENLSLGANISYSKIKSKGGSVPCNDATQPAISATNPINFCVSPSGQVLNQDAPFNATFNGSYTVPVANGLDAYFRFNLNIKGRNPNFGNFRSASGFKSTPSYALLDLFAGVTRQEGVWELGFFAKNVFDKQVELSRVTPVNNIYGPYAVAPGGYDVVRTSFPREIGVSLRYAFGSR